MENSGRRHLYEERILMDKKLKAIIYNLKPRDEYSTDIIEGRQCQYVFGGKDQADQFYCGHRTVATGVPYCEEHYALCYRGTAAKKKLKQLI